MLSSTRIVYCCACCFLTAVALVFLSWTLVSVYSFARQTLLEANANEEEEEELGLCPCIFGRRFNVVQTTAGVTLGSVAFTWFGIFIGLICGVWVTVECHNQAEHSVKYHRTSKILVIVVYMSLFIGYALLCVTHFERLRMAFAGSSQQLPKWAPNVLYFVLFAEMLLYAIGTVLRYKEPILSAVAFAAFALVYLGSVSALIGKFFAKTMKVARSNEQCEKQIVEIALRIGISATVSLLSTTLTFVIMVSWINVCPQCLTWRFARIVVQLFDVCLNAFCLMCAYNRAEAYYMCFFGPLHKWWLHKLTVTRTQPVHRSRAALSVLVAAKYKTMQTTLPSATASS